MLNAQGYIDLMSHALGKTPDARHSLWDTFNRAGRALVTRRTWAWRQHGPVQILGVASQDHIDLPADFGGELASWISTTGFYGALRKVDLATIAGLRQSEVVVGSVQGWSGGWYVYWPGYASQPSLEDLPSKRVLIYPTPTASGTPTIELIYRRNWITIAENDGSRVPNIPEEFEQALVCLARSMTWHLENQSPCQDDTDAEAEIVRLINEDATQQVLQGRMRGGASSRMVPDWWNRSGGRYPQQATL